MIRLTSIYAVMCAAVMGQPSLSSLTPGGLLPGMSQEVILYGDKLVPPLTLWSAADLTFAQIEPAADHKSVNCTITTGKGIAVGLVGIVTANTSGASNPLMLMIDDLISVVDNGMNHSLGQAPTPTPLTHHLILDSHRGGCESPPTCQNGQDM